MGKRTQEQRSVETRTALLEAAAKGFVRHGYAKLTLEQVARDAGYTRGALYHQFNSKEDLAIALIHWIGETWRTAADFDAPLHSSPLESLIALAQAHVRFCRNGMARLLLILRIEPSGEDHPVHQAVFEMMAPILQRCTDLIRAGQEQGELAEEPEASLLARVFLLTVETVVLSLGEENELAERVVTRTVCGLLGVLPRE